MLGANGLIRHAVTMTAANNNDKPMTRHANAPRPMVAAALALVAGMAASAPAQAEAVAALGRIEPEGGVVLIAAPSLVTAISGSLVTELRVAEGDRVAAGDVLAVLDSAKMLRAALARGEAELELALRAAEAADSVAEEACVRAAVAAREAERRTSLLERDLASREETEQAEGDAEARAASCTAARANARVAEASVGVARATLDVEQAELERAFVRAPFAGRVLRVHAHPGEFTLPHGILELARTDRMLAVAEVFETDIRHVAVGQTAQVSSDVLDAPLTGTVQRIRPKVAKQDVVGTDPVAAKDARIVEVEIRLDDSAAVADLTNLQVEILIGD